MPTSEQNRPAPDEVMREMVRQFADSAPLAPAWDTLGLHPAVREHGNGRRHGLLLVAAVTALVVVGLWWMISPEPEVPADVPIVTVPSVPTGATSEVRLSDLGPVEAQLCLTRKNVRLLVANEAALVAPDDGLAGYTPDRARLGLFAPPVNSFASVLDHPALDPDTAARLDELVEQFRTVDALAFAGEGATEAPEFSAALDDLAAALAADVEQTSDPALCSVDGDVAPDGDTGRSYGRCVAAVRLDAALAQVAATGSEADVGVAVGAGVGLRQWYDRPPPEIVELVALLDALVDLPADRRPEAAEEAQLRLAPQWSGPESRCAEEFVEP